MAKYTNSPLVGYTRLVNKHSGQRTHSIDRITPHCVVGQVTAARLGDIFSGTRDVSFNYDIALDGTVGLCAVRTKINLSEKGAALEVAPLNNQGVIDLTYLPSGGQNVASGVGQANKAWKTDENGNPAWRDIAAPTDAQVQTAVDNYLDKKGVVFNTSVKITEVLNGN